MSDSPEKPATDVVLLGPPTADGEGVRVLRAREDRIEAGEVRPVKHGAPLHSGTEIVKLSPRADSPQVCDVEVTYAQPVTGKRGKGPAQVASSSYREGWDEIFGKREDAHARSVPDGLPGALPDPKTLN